MRIDPAKLKSARERRAMTQEGLAARCELSRKSIQRLERGADVRAETVAGVAAALGVNLEELMEAAAQKPQAAHRDRRVILRRARSGTRVFDILARTYAGRITCDVEVTGEIVGPLTELIGALQGLVSEHWGEGPQVPSDLPLVERLRTIATLNDALRALEPHRVGCFIGHYYRYVVEGASDGGSAASAAGAPVVLSRIHLTHLGRDFLQAPTEEEWASRPSGRPTQAEVPLAEVFQREERFVFLESEPPLQAASGLDDDGVVIDAEYAVLAR